MIEDKQYLTLITVLDPDGAVQTYHEGPTNLGVAARRMREVVDQGLIITEGQQARLYPPHRVLLAEYQHVDEAEP